MLILQYTNVGTTTVTELTVVPNETLNNALLNISGQIDSIYIRQTELDTYDNLLSELIYTYSYKNMCFLINNVNDLPKKMRKIPISSEANEYINSILHS